MSVSIASKLGEKAVAAIACVVSVALVISIPYGFGYFAGKKHAEAADAAQLQVDADELKACAVQFASLTEQTRQAADEAKAQQAAAQQQVAQAQADAEQQQAKASAANKALQAAKSVPACAAQLKEELCSAIELL